MPRPQDLNRRSALDSPHSSISPAPVVSTPATSPRPSPALPDDTKAGLDRYASVYTPAWLLRVASQPLPLYAQTLAEASRDAAALALEVVPPRMLERWQAAERASSADLNQLAAIFVLSPRSLDAANYASKLLRALREEHQAMTAGANAATLFDVPIRQIPSPPEASNVALYELVARSSRENVPPIDLGDSVHVRRVSLPFAY